MLLIPARASTRPPALLPGSLRDPQITAWVTPQNLPHSTRTPVPAADTVFDEQGRRWLGSTPGGALTDQCHARAEAAAERRRAACCALVAFDEAANVRRINDLPLLYSHFGSRASSR